MMEQVFNSWSCRVYCAGPLFNQPERDEMTLIADNLNRAGFPVYLPHRDGMEFRLVHHVLTGKGWPAADAARFLHEAIFALDIYQLVVECEAVVWNLNGRVPDEGAVAEAAIAWTLGKPLVAFHADARTLISGRLNPMLVGLVEFETVSEIEAIPAKIVATIQGDCDSPVTKNRLPRRIATAVEAGRTLWIAMKEQQTHPDDEAIAEIVERLFADGPRLNVTS